MTLPPSADQGEDADARAFAALVEHAGARLVGLAVALLGDRAGAEDVVQEALARVWRRRRALAPGALDGYVRQAVRHLALDRRARRDVEARALAGRVTAAADAPAAREPRARWGRSTRATAWRSSASGRADRLI